MRKYFPAVAAAMILTGCGTSGAENEPVRKVDMTVSGAYDTEVSDVTATDAESDTFYGVLMDECCSDIDEHHRTSGQSVCDRNRDYGK